MEIPNRESDDEVEVHRFAVLIEKVMDKKSGAMHVSMKTQGTGIPMAEASVILKGWAEKVQSEIQKPFVDNMMFGINESGKQKGPGDSEGKP